MQNKKQKIKFKGFTLVELIIVITILAILATIAFTYFSGYAGNARNSKRVSDIKNIEKALELKITTVGKTPIPDSLVKINSEDTLIGYQGEVGKNVVSFLSLGGDFKDPSTGENYLYLTNSLTNKGQVAAYMENENSTGTGYLSKTPTYTGSPLGLILQKDNAPIHKNQSIISAGGFNTLTGSFINEDVKILFGKDNLLHKPFIIGGQLLQLSKGYSFEPPRNCPKNYIPVPGDIDLGQPGFCVGKYEASYEFGTGSTLITTEGKDVATSLNSTVTPLCYKDGFTMLTLMQRLTIARNIERNPENWSGGKVGVGYIKTGNSGDNTTGFSNGGVLATGPSGNTTNDEKRQLKLSNGEVIWDFIGNAWEAVAPFNLSTGENEITKYTHIGFNWFDNISMLTSYNDTNTAANNSFISINQLTDINYKTIFGPINNIENAGLGYYRYSSTVGSVFVTGGSHLGGNAGLYSLFKYNQIADVNITTRCVYIK